MSFSKSLTLSTLSIFLLIVLLFTSTRAADFIIQNNCPYTVWPAAVPFGGGQLNQGQIMSINAPSGASQTSIWGRTNCSFDSNGRGNCQTGDCNGRLLCNSSGAPPVTLAEYQLRGVSNQDFLDISLVRGFNVPMEFSPMSSECNRSIKCSAPINEACPNELKAPGGCHNPCTVFQTDQYCCGIGKCGPTSYSRFFKERCPDAYSYPLDDKTSTFTCPTGTNYKVVFCPDRGDTSIESKMQLYLVCEI